MKFGLLNMRSAVNKAALIHDFVHDENFDVVALTETWIAADAPDAIKLDVAPPGYSVCHQPRRLSSGKSRGGGVAVICRESLKMSTAFDLSSADFESLAVNITTKSSTITVVCVYRPPGSVTTATCDALSDLFDQLLLHSRRFVVCGDFNVPGADGSSLDPQVESLLSRYNLVQHVHQPTHTAGNLLDVIITGDSDCQIVTDTTVTQTCLSTDHYLVSCKLQLTVERPSIVSFSYRDVQKIDLAAFRADLAQSKLLQCSDDLDANACAELMNDELRQLMDCHAPIKQKVKWRGKNDYRWLSPEARAAKQL